MIKHDDQASPVQDKVKGVDLATDVTLPHQAGTPVHLGDLLGKTAIVLYFYGMDNAVLCTAEACAFLDSKAGQVAIMMSPTASPSLPRCHKSWPG